MEAEQKWRFELINERWELWGSSVIDCVRSQNSLYGEQYDLRDALVHQG